MSLAPQQLERFVAGLASSPDRWRHLVRHASDARVYEQIWDDEEINAWVICWSADQDTGFHDHDLSAAAIAVISGEVRGERLRLGSAPQARTFRGGSTFSVSPVAIHRVLHAGVAPAVTIHAYSPPLVRTGAYRTGRNGEPQARGLLRRGGAARRSRASLIRALIPGLEHSASAEDHTFLRISFAEPKKSSNAPPRPRRARRATAPG